MSRSKGILLNRQHELKKETFPVIPVQLSPAPLLATVQPDSERRLFAHTERYNSNICFRYSSSVSSSYHHRLYHTVAIE